VSGRTPAADSSSFESLLSSIVEDFSARRRLGSAPSVEEYAARHPEHAGDIRDVLQTVSELEDLEPPGSEVGPVTGMRLGAYLLERELGRGGMGVVYLATDEELGRRVALKLLPLHATLNPRFLARFRREARAAAGLQHPNIVPVYGVGEHGGVHFYVMRYVDGLALDEVVQALDVSLPDSEAGTLATQLVHCALPGSGSDDGTAPGPDREGWQVAGVTEDAGRRGAVYARNVARIGKHVAGALAFAHARGILHRDIKPANLLLDGEGRVWVADFGLCKSSDADPLTGSADVVGTLRYMAPEQLRGESDVRTDVYGLGISLYELLTGKPPFADATRERLFDRVMNHEPPRPRRVEPGVPRDLEAIVLRAMAKLPEERYGTAEALARDLEAYLTGRPIAARPPSVLHLLRLVVRRNRLVAGTIATALVVLLVASVLYVRGVGVERRERELQLALANLAAAEASMEVDPILSGESLARVPPEHRGWEWKHFAALADQSIDVVANGLGRSEDVGLTFDGRLVVAGGDSSLWVGELTRDERDESERALWRLAPTNGVVWNVAVAPDGLHAASSTREGRVELWSLSGDPERVATRDMSFSVNALAFAASSEVLYVGGRDGVVRGFDVALGPIFEQRGHESWVAGIAPLPDGRYLSCGFDGALRLGDPAQGESRLIRSFGDRLYSVDVDRAGRRAAVGGQDHTVRIVELETGREPVVLAGHRGAIHRVLFSADGRWLYSASEDKTIRVWDAERGLAARTLHGHRSEVEGLALAAGTTLVSVGRAGTIRRWDAGAGGGFLALDGHHADIWHTRFDPGGERAVTTGRDGTVRLWDAVTGVPLRVLVGHLYTPTRATFSPDGRRIVSGDMRGFVREWDIASGETTAAFDRGPTTAVDDLQFTSEGELWIHVLGRIELWRRSQGGWSEVRRVERPELTCFDVGADGRIVLATRDGGLELLEADTLATLWRLEGATAVPPPDVEFSPDGGTIHLTAGQEVRSFDALDGSLLGRLEVGGDVVAISCTPDGERLACASTNLGVALWSLTRGEPLARLQGPGRGVTTVDVSSDGRRILSGTWDGRVRLWDDLQAVERHLHRSNRRLLAPAAERLLDRLVADDPQAGAAPHRFYPRIREADATQEVRAVALELAHARAGGRAELETRVREHLMAAGRTRTDVRLALVLGHGLEKAFAHEPQITLLYSEAQVRWGEYDPAVYERVRQRLEAALDTTLADADVRLETLALLTLTLVQLDRPDDARVALDEARALATARELELHAAELLAEAEVVLAAEEGR